MGAHKNCLDKAILMSTHNKGFYGDIRQIIPLLYHQISSNKGLIYSSIIVTYRLIINDNLDKGSQLPYIKWARENGYALLVANTNINSVEMTVKGKKKKEPVRIRVRYLWGCRLFKALLA